MAVPHGPPPSGWTAAFDVIQMYSWEISDLAMQGSVEDSFQSKATVVKVELYLEVFCLFYLSFLFVSTGTVYCIVQFEYLVSLKEQLNHLGIS